jgi:hypothetical protein
VTVLDRARPGSARRIHPAWWAAAVTFLALVGAAAFRAVPGVLIDPLRDEFGWSVSTTTRRLRSTWRSTG